jgi:hypothetical protein
MTAENTQFHKRKAWAAVKRSRLFRPNFTTQFHTGRREKAPSAALKGQADNSPGQAPALRSAFDEGGRAGAPPWENAPRTAASLFPPNAFGGKRELFRQSRPSVVLSRSDKAESAADCDTWPLVSAPFVFVSGRRVEEKWVLE